jgi:hypothetical protein
MANQPINWYSVVQALNTLQTPTTRARLRRAFEPLPYVPQPSAPATPPPPNYILDPNDPMAINSAVDLALNQAGLDKNYRDDIESVPILNELIKVPVVGDVLAGVSERIPAAIDLLYNSTIKPIANGGHFGAAVLNSLTNATETLDVLANPIKGFVLEGPEGAWKGFGFHPEGRKVYNYDIKSGGGPVIDFVLNMAAEMLSDPFNYVSFGGEGIIKAVAKGASKDAIAAATKAAAKQLVADGTERIIKEVGQEAAEAVTKYMATHVDDVVGAADVLRPFIMNDDTITQVAKTTAKIYGRGDSTIQEALVRANKAVENSVKLRKYTDTALDQLTIRPIMQTALASATFNDTTVNVLKGLRKAVDISDKAQSALLQAAMVTAGPGIPWLLGKQIFKRSWEGTFAARRVMDIMKQYTPSGTLSLVDLPKVERQMDDFLRTVPDVARQNPELSDTLRSTLYEGIVRDEQLEFLAVLERGISAEEKYQRLNKLCLERNKMTLEDYVEFLKNDAGRSPFISGHAEVLDDIHTNLTRLRYEEYNRGIAAAGRSLLAEMERFSDIGSTESQNLDRFRVFLTQTTVFPILQQIARNGEAPLLAKELSALMDKYEKVAGTISWRKFLLQYDATDLDYDSPLLAFLFQFRDAYRTAQKGTLAIRELADLTKFVEEIRHGDAFRMQAYEAMDTHILSLLNAKMLPPGFAQYKPMLERMHQAIMNYSLTGDLMYDAAHTIDDVYNILRADVGRMYKAIMKHAPTTNHTITLQGIVDNMRQRSFEHLQKLQVTDPLTGAKTPLLRETAKHAPADEATMHQFHTAAFELRTLWRTLNRLDLENIVYQTVYTRLGTAIESLSRDMSATDYAVVFQDIQDILEDLSEVVRKAGDKSVGELAYTVKEVDLGDGLTETIRETYKKYPNETLYMANNEPLSQLLDRAYAKLEALPLEQFLTPTPEMLDTFSNSVYYTIKQAQAAVAANLYSIEELHQFIDDVLYGSDFMDSMKIFARDDAFASRLDGITEFAKQFAQLQRLYKHVMENPVLGQDNTELRVALFDTLQRYATMRFETFREHSPYYVSKIKEALTDQINSTKMGRRLDQENIIKGLRDKLPADSPDRARYARILDNLHDPVVDIEANEIILREELKHEFAPGEAPVFFDIETTGLNSAADQALQIAYKLPGMDQAKVIFIRATEDMTPADDILFKLCKQPNEGMVPIEELYARFNARFVNNPAAKDEQEAIAEFLADLHSLPEDSAPVLIGHNIEVFDKQFLTGRLRYAKNWDAYAKAKEVFNTWRTIDTLQELRKADHYFALTPDQSDEITRIIENYLHTVETLAEVGESTTLIPQVGRGFMDDLHGLVQALIDNSKNLEVLPVDVSANIQYLRNLSQQIAIRLQEVRNANVLEGGYMMLRDEIPLAGINALHSTQVTTVTTEVISNLAVRRAIDMDIMREFFDMPAEINSVNAMYMTKIAQRIMRIRDKATNIEPLQAEGMLDELRSFGRILKEKLDAALLNDKKKPVWRSVRLDKPSVRDIYAQVAYLYQEARTAGVITASKDAIDFARLFPDYARVGELLTNPDILRRNEVVQDEILQDFFEVALRQETMEAQDVVRQFNNMAGQVTDWQKAVEKYKARMVQAGAEAPGSIGTLGMQEYILPHMQKIYELMHKYQNILGAAGSKEAKKLARAELRQISSAAQAYGTAMNRSVFHYLMEASPTELQTYVWKLAHSQVVIDLTTFIKEQGTPEMVNRFLSRAKALEDYGLKIKQIDSQLYIWVPKNNFEMFQKMQFEKLTYRIPEPQIKTLPKEFADALRESRQALLYLSDGDLALATGDIMTPRQLTYIRSNIPKEVANDLIPVDTLRANDMFIGTSFDHTFLGDMQASRAWRSARSINPAKNYVKVMEYYMANADMSAKIIAATFGSTTPLGLRAVFKGMSPEEIIKELHAHPDVVVAAVQKFSKYKRGYKITRVFLTTAEDVRAAEQAGAIVLAKSAYNMFHNIINTIDLGKNHAFANWMGTYIVDPYKAGYLTSLGLLMRNAIDSTTKNLVTTGNPAEVMDMMIHQFQTFKVWRQYEQDVAELMRRSGGFITGNILRAYFKEPANAGRLDMFKLIHTFINEGPSAGLAKSQAQLVEDMSKAMRDDEHFIRRAARWLTWKNWFTRPIMKANSVIEQVARLSKFTWELSHGETFQDAVAAVIKTHFDYKTKSIAQLYLELFVPFATFTIENIKFWFEMMTKHGWVAGIMRDIYTPFMDIDGYSQYELNNNRSLQYAILNGSMRLNDDGLVLKLGPSMLDALNTMTDPANSLLNRVIVPLRIPASGIIATLKGEDFDWKRQFSENLPLVGPILQRYWGLGDANLESWQLGTALKGFARTGNILPILDPSLFGSMQRNYYFSYPGSNKIYMTHDADVYDKHILNGAEAVLTQEQAEEVYGRARPEHEKKIYARRAYARKAYIKKLYARRVYVKRRKARKYYPRKKYAKRYYPKRGFFRGTYLPKNFSDGVFNRVMNSVRQSQMRIPGTYRNYAHTAPGIYKKIYSGTGKVRFTSRLMPYNVQNIKYRIRQGWSSL